MTGVDPRYTQGPGYILQDLEPVPGLPSSIKIAGHAFHQVTDFHASLVPISHIAQQLQQKKRLDQKEALAQVTEAAIKAVNKRQPKLAAYRNELRIASHPAEDRASLIVLCHIPQLKSVFEDMQSDLGMSLDVLPAHVTLFTDPKDSETVGIRTADELIERSRPLSRKEASALESVINPYKSFRWSMFMTPGPVRNNLILELHVPGFRSAKEFYGKFGFHEVAYDPISGGGDSDLGYVELKREDSLGRTQLNFYGDKSHVAKHAHFNQFPENTPRGYGVEITVPVDDVEHLWNSVGKRHPQESISQALEVKRWGRLDFRLVDPYGFYVRFTEPVDWWQDI